MALDGTSPFDPPQDKPSAERTGSTGKPRARGAAAGSADSRGRSGYGIDSLRPHLHEQLALRDLLRRPATGDDSPVS